MDVKLFGYFTLRAPLSHIGASESTYSELVRWPVIGEDGTAVEVPVYAGNAWRGQLRDLAATYLLEKLGNPAISLEAFHLLYAGGKIGGELSVNLEKLRRVRQLLTPIELFGGGVGNQIVPGKLRVSPCYPVCREAARVLNFTPEPRAQLADLLCDMEFTRRDDSKDSRLNNVIAWPADQLALDVGSPRKRGDEPATQMRVTVETLAAGTQLETQIWLLDGSEVALGCLVSALWQFSKAPHIGGMSGRGLGLVDLTYDLLDLDTGEVKPFFAIAAGVPRLAAPAEAAKEAYDAHCLRLYEAMLDERQDQVRALLAG